MRVWDEDYADSPIIPNFHLNLCFGSEENSGTEEILPSFPAGLRFMKSPL